MYYAIRDVVTGYYLSSCSFAFCGRTCYYITYTGKLWTSFFPCKKTVEMYFGRLKCHADMTGIQIDITKINPETLPYGKIIVNTIKY